MNKRITLIMTVAVLAGFGILLLMNIASMLGYVAPRYISANDVKGIAIEHNKTTITANLTQQTAIIDILNRSFPVSKDFAQARKTTEKHPADVQKIIIYRIKGADIEIIPAGYVNKAALNPDPTPSPDDAFMVFSTSEWNTNGYLEEAHAGEFNKLLLSTYETK